MEKMKTILNSDLKTKIEEVESQLNEKVQLVQIPNSDGLMLVLIDSDEYKKREKDLSIFMEKINDKMVICSK